MTYRQVLALMAVRRMCGDLGTTVDVSQDDFAGFVTDVRALLCADVGMQSVLINSCNGPTYVRAVTVQA